MGKDCEWYAGRCRVMLMSIDLGYVLKDLNEIKGKISGLNQKLKKLGDQKQ
jgi:hypothetical protein